MAELTGADVAASDDRTGHESLGGDWDLEYTAGDIEAEVAVSLPVQAKWAATLNQGTAVWNENGTTTPQYNLFDGTNFGTEGNSTAIGGWEVIQGAEAPTRDEAIVVGLQGGKTITGQMWDGTSWTALSINPLGNAKNAESFSFDVAYEAQSGDALLVWNDSPSLKFSVWDGSNWTAPTTVAAYTGADPVHLRLDASPVSDEMVLVLTDGSNHDYALVWGGSSWGDQIQLNTVGSQDVTDVSVTFEQQSGHAMVAYAKDQVDVHYRTWDGTSWSSEATLTAAALADGKARWTMMDADPYSDRIVMGVITESSHAYLAVWDGTTWNAGDKLLASIDLSNRTVQNFAVAFESQSGQALATYAENGNSVIQYHTWNSGSGWSAAMAGPNLGDDGAGMTLDADPQSDNVMLSVVDQGKDVSFVLWDGTSWGTPSEQEIDAGLDTGQPFAFVWDAGSTPRVSLANATVTLAEDADTTGGLKVADIVITDDGQGTNELALSGADAALFEIVGSELRIQDGVTLDFETNAVLDVTVEVDDTSVGSTPDDTAVLTINLTNVDEPGVNDAPENTVPGSQAIDQDGMLLFSSATGTAISVSDFDAGSGLMQVTLTATNGTLNLSGNKGLTFTPPADGTADATMTFTGTVTDINAALEGMTFVATPGFTGTASVQIVTNDQGNTGTGSALSDTDTVAIMVQTADQKLWLTLKDDINGSGDTENLTTTGGDVLTYSDITQLETSDLPAAAPATSGTLAHSFNLDTVLLSDGVTQASNDGNTQVNALHHVTKDIQVGTNNFQLFAGDILLSTLGSEIIGGVTYDLNDVFVFRPDTPGDYSRGSFRLLIDGSDIGLGRVTAVSLVEQSTVFGDTTLAAGEFLLAHDSSSKNVLRFTPGNLGDTATTSGSTTLLLAGGDIDIGQTIGGIHLVQVDTVLGGKTLSAGQLLMSLQANDSTVGNGTTIDVKLNDIFIVDVTTTYDGSAGSTEVAAHRFFEGLDESLDSGNEAIWGIGYQGNSAPTVSADTFTLDENSPDGTIVGTVPGTDPEREAAIASLLAADPDLVYSAETGKFYKVSSSSVTWTAANTAAGSELLNGIAGELVTIQSQAENDIVHTFAQGVGDVWIGASDAVTEGAFYWYEDGSESTDRFWSGGSSGSATGGAYTNFGSGEPSDSLADRDYVDLDNSTGQWQVETNSGTQEYVIQWDASEVLGPSRALTYAITAGNTNGAFAIDAENRPDHGRQHRRAGFRDHGDVHSDGRRDRCGRCLRHRDHHDQPQRLGRKYAADDQPGQYRHDLVRGRRHQHGDQDRRYRDQRRRHRHQRPERDRRRRDAVRDHRHRAAPEGRCGARLRDQFEPRRDRTGRRHHGRQHTGR